MSAVRGPARFLLLLFALTACSKDDGGTRSAVVRDSAGVTVVEFDTTGVTLPLWTARDSPLVVIGQVEGPPEYILEMVSNAHRLSDGRIVIVDDGAHAVRFYDARGTHLYSVGREGTGPGEFEGWMRSRLGPGDSIFILDSSSRRMSVIAPEGEFARSFRLEEFEQESFAAPYPAGILDDGRVLVTFGYGVHGPPTGESYMIRDTTPLLVYSPEGAVLDSIGRWPGNEAFVFSTGRTLIVGPPAVGRTTTFLAAGDRVIVADNDRWEVRILGADGATRRILRGRMQPRPLTDAEVDAYRSRAEDADLPERMRDRIREMPLPETYPAFRDVLVAEDGLLWLADYRSGLDDGPRRWTVLGLEGPVARVATPDDVPQVFAAGDGWVLGARYDALGITRVVLLPLHEPAE